jgi:hypothetical protein
MSVCSSSSIPSRDGSLLFGRSCPTPSPRLPRLFIFDTCTNLIEHLKSAPIQKEGRAADIDETVEAAWETRFGHGHAAARNGALAWPRPSGPAAEDEPCNLAASSCRRSRTGGTTGGRGIAMSGPRESTSSCAASGLGDVVGDRRFSADGSSSSAAPSWAADVVEGTDAARRSALRLRPAATRRGLGRPAPNPCVVNYAAFTLSLFAILISFSSLVFTARADRRATRAEGASRARIIVRVPRPGRRVHGPLPWLQVRRNEKSEPSTHAVPSSGSPTAAGLGRSRRSWRAAISS